MKRTSPYFFALLLSIILLTTHSNAGLVTISGVPAYNWYHGCGPTAAASILGYYDLHGYDSLFDASGWDEVRLTSNIQDEISSPEHNAMYDPYPDLPGPEPPDTSIADFFHTSEGQPYGWSLQSDANNAFVGYADYRGYEDWNASFTTYFDFTWNDFTNEIDNGNPMLFLIDTDGNGYTDHFVPVFGYNDETREYACYTTWSEDETIQWESFQGSGNPWGVSYATYVTPGEPDVVPEPATMLLLGTGLVGLAVPRIRKRFEQ